MERRKDMTAEAFPRATGTLPLASSADLVARAQRGEEAAFAALFKVYNRRVYWLCLRMAGSPAEAEDLTQEVFLKLFRKISTFRGESAFSTWLHRLAVNEILMHYPRSVSIQCLCRATTLRTSARPNGSMGMMTCT
jgi:RNA polymerase sigma-70 factor, ECF subfamily